MINEARLEAVGSRLTPADEGWLVVNVVMRHVAQRSVRASA